MHAPPRAGALIFIALLYTTAPAGRHGLLNLHGTVNSAVGSSEAKAASVRTPMRVNGGNPAATEASLQYEQRPEWMKRWRKPTAGSGRQERGWPHPVLQRQD
jgi:cation/acetate symporter